jgi:hypothetical protein
MNNDQFRKLLNTPAPQDDATNNNNARPSAVPSSLGSKRSSFMPMTPRSVRGGGSDFARQLADRQTSTTTAARKFKNSAAPRGSKLAHGFTDRTQSRYDHEADDKAARITALEDQVKLGQLDNATFQALRDQITRGDAHATHLVKGLDRKLLERVRRGEDVLGGHGQPPPTDQDLQDEFDKLEEKKVARLERERTLKKGEMAPPPPPLAGAKRSRDQILAELKAQRQAAAQARLAARPELGDKFRAVGASSAASSSSSRIQVDAKGRQVLMTVDEHGNVKKKVRKVQLPVEETTNNKFLDEGVTVPALKPVETPVDMPKEDSDDDIFQGIGDAYDPLGGMDDDDDDEDEDDDDDDEDDDDDPTPQPSEPSPVTDDMEPKTTQTSMPPPPPPPRNYFASATTSTTSTTSPPLPPQNPFNDAAFLAAVKKAGALSNISLSLSSSNPSDPLAPESAEAKEARLQKRAQLLAASDRDLEDMDLGFGSSRFGDDEEEEGGAQGGGNKVKLSTWKGGVLGLGNDDDGQEGQDDGKWEKDKKKKQQQQQGRKRKGNVDSAKDVLAVMERRRREANK